jgi:hypothetical protein
MDGYGRLLCFLNVNEPDRARRPEDYSLRALRAGLAVPYFIWPNIDPFRGTSSILDAVIAPGTANHVADSTPALRRARDFVKQARANGGANTVFDPNNPLRFEAFEVRYLGRRDVPNRAVIDMSRNDNVILQPQHYFHPMRKINYSFPRVHPAVRLARMASRGWFPGWTVRPQPTSAEPVSKQILRRQIRRWWWRSA